VSVRFWREALKRKLIRAARLCAGAVANLAGRRAARAAFARRPVLALCQSAAFGRIDNGKDGVGSNARATACRWFAGAAPFMV
jgi:hypothetical protein